MPARALRSEPERSLAIASRAFPGVDPAARRRATGSPLHGLRREDLSLVDQLGDAAQAFGLKMAAKPRHDRPADVDLRPKKERRGSAAGQEPLEVAFPADMVVFEEITQPLEPVRVERALWLLPEGVAHRAVSRLRLDGFLKRQFFEGAVVGNF